MISEEKIITGADKLFDLVEEENQITLTNAANILKVNRGLAEQWAEIMEEQGMIKIRQSFSEKHLISNESNESSLSIIKDLMGIKRKNKDSFSEISREQRESFVREKKMLIKKRKKLHDLFNKVLDKKEKLDTLIETNKIERDNLKEKEEELLAYEKELRDFKQHLMNWNKRLEEKEKDLESFNMIKMITKKKNNDVKISSLKNTTN